MNVNIRRIKSGDEHTDQKWYVLEGYVDGVPAVTKRVSISMAAAVQDPSIITRARTKLIADVNEYYQNWLMLEQLNA
jgi:hypothetical protein